MAIENVTKAALGRIKPERLESHLASLARAKSRLAEIESAQKAAGSEAMERIEELRALPEPWASRTHTPEEIVSALATGATLGSVVLRALRMKVHDVLFSFRERGGVERVEASFRTGEGMVKGDPIGSAGIFADELSAAFGMGDESKRSFPSDHSSASLKREMEHRSVQLRLQSVPVYPQGADVIMRVSTSAKLTPEEAQSQEDRRSAIAELRVSAKKMGEKAVMGLLESWKAGFGGESSEMGLVLALESGNLGGIRQALSGGADPNAESFSFENQSAGWQSPLHLAVRRGADAAESIEALLAAGADPDRVDQRGETPLANACGLASLDAARALLGASLVDAQGFNGRSALAEAAWSDRPDVVRLLVGSSSVDMGESLIDPSEQRPHEPASTALWLAAQEGYLECCRILIEHGADPRLKDQEGKSAIDNASDHARSQEVVDLLEDQARRLDERDALESMLPEGSASLGRVDALGRAPGL